MFFLKNGPKPASFCLFSFFSRDKYITNLTVNDKSIDGVLGTRTRGGMMEGADESTELLRHPIAILFTRNGFFNEDEEHFIRDKLFIS